MAAHIRFVLRPHYPQLAYVAIVGRAAKVQCKPCLSSPPRASKPCAKTPELSGSGEEDLGYARQHQTSQLFRAFQSRCTPCRHFIRHCEAARYRPYWPCGSSPPVPLAWKYGG